MSSLKKSPINVGINGMGRIGRLIFREGFDHLNIKVLNSNSSSEMTAHLLKYDSVHGSWDKKVSSTKKELVIDDQKIDYLREKSPSDIDWSKYDVDLVIECSGRFKKSSDWIKAFSQAVKTVIVSAPVEDPDLTLVYGVNQSSYDKTQHKFISNASCTTNCLAPLVKVLKESCGVERGFFSTTHSYTNDQRLLDSSHKKDFRRARAAGLNIIPTSTGAGKALALIFPELKGCIQGVAFRVPTANVSLLDLVVETKKASSLEEMHKVFEKAVKGSLKGVLALEDKPLVSSDFIGRKESSILDWSLSSFQGEKLLKLVSWYDNEMGFSQRIIDFICSMK